jgi:hypothetical protein
MASRLTPCPSCSRHVKIGPPSCPFCGGDVPTEVAPRVLKLAPGASITRAALMFAGATAVNACSSSTTSTTPTPDATADVGHGQPLYGGFTPELDATDDLGHAVPLYGNDAGPFQEPDAGVDAGPGQLDAAYGVIIDAGHDATADATPGVDATADTGMKPEDAGQGGAAYGLFADGGGTPGH